MDNDPRTHSLPSGLRVADLSQRPQCSVFIATSLDGFIAREDGSIDWLDVAHAQGEDYGYAAFIETVDALAIGRHTYETVQTFPAWPYDGKRCVVVSRTLTEVAHGAELWRRSCGELVDQLSKQGIRRVYVDGGELIRSFLAEGLIDDMIISVVPVMIGRGRRLLGGACARLTLESSQQYATGVVQQRYRVQR